MTTSERPVIGFLTDFGLDGAAAICRAVILSICGEAQIVDICHTVRKFAVREGAYLLRGALPWFPVGVHLAVVDPGVGTARRPIALRSVRGDLLVGPDNGLLLPAADALGGIVEARELTNRDLWLPVTSSTFHGRDIFAPVTAHLAIEPSTFEQVGPLIGTETLVRLAGSATVAGPGRIETEVAYIDSFGNIRLATSEHSLDEAFAERSDGDSTAIRVTVGDGAGMGAVMTSTFGAVPPGSIILYVDSSGDLALAESQGDLARRLGTRIGVPVVIESV